MGSALEGGVDARDSWGWWRGTLSLGVGRLVDGLVLLLLVNASEGAGFSFLLCQDLNSVKL